MKVAVWEGNLSDDYVRWASQIGVDGIDIHDPLNVPGVREQGFPDMERLLKLRKRLRAMGLRIYRVSLPSVNKFLMGESGGEEEIENICKTIEYLGEASIPIARPRFLDTPAIFTTHLAEHKGGYMQRAYNLELMKKQLAGKQLQAFMFRDFEEHWSQCIQVYQRIVPVAEDSNVMLALHPSDPPIPGAPFSSLGLHRILDAVPSKNNGLLYCVGTRCEAGGPGLVLDEINHYGRRGKIFEVHFRNVRGSLVATGGFEEAALDDGDMNMFDVLRALHRVGYDGPLNPDHVPQLEGDTHDRKIAFSYAVGYIRALLTALETSL